MMATEKRLISLDEAKKLFDDIPPYIGMTGKCVQGMLEKAPTVDAVEVVHGRWVWSEENECWVCSNCKMSALNNYRGNSTDSNYCPNCGAKIDGGEA